MKHKGHAKAYLTVWGTLLFLTAATVIVSYFDFGSLNIWVAMFVATVKATLVCLYFMHLKYDNRVNQVVFLSAFAFLAIFILFTASDELTRVSEKAMSVSQDVRSDGVDSGQWRAQTSELLIKGQELYTVQCAVCHGPQGKGDGAGAAALNPKPRDFTSGYWRFGGQPTPVFKTITEGSPGTGMASFASLSVEERWALTHFVRSLSPNPPADSPEDLAALKTSSQQELPKPAQPIPVSFAMKRLAEGAIGIADVTELPKNREAFNFGERLYQTNCISCHGANGKGGIPITRITVNPPVYLTTKDFRSAQGGWVYNRSEFIDLISKGLPGLGKPGMAHFSDAEWDALYQHVQFLKNR